MPDTINRHRMHNDGLRRENMLDSHLITKKLNPKKTSLTGILVVKKR